MNDNQARYLSTSAALRSWSGQETWTIRYTSRDGRTWLQGRYADKAMAEMNARLAMDAGAAVLTEATLTSAEVVLYGS